MAVVVNWGPFFIFSRFLHAVAGPGDPLGGLADAAGDGGWFSLAQKCWGKHRGSIQVI